MPIHTRLLLAVLVTVALSSPRSGAGADPAPESAGSTAAAVPDLGARDLDGRPFQLAEAIQHGPVVITFWATWCKPCRKELPELQKLVEAFGEQGLQVVAVNGDGPVDAAKIRPYVRARKYDFIVIPDPDGEIRRRFQVEVFPTTFVVDGAGTVRHRQVGYRQGDEVRVKALIEEMLAEEPSDGLGDNR